VRGRVGAVGAAREYGDGVASCGQRAAVGSLVDAEGSLDPSEMLPNDPPPPATSQATSSGVAETDSLSVGVPNTVRQH